MTAMFTSIKIRGYKAHIRIGISSNFVFDKVFAEKSEFVEHFSQFFEFFKLNTFHQIHLMNSFSLEVSLTNKRLLDNPKIRLQVYKN